jgi:hypothetical protein
VARGGAERLRRQQRLSVEELERHAERARNAAIALSSKRLRPALRRDAIDLPFFGEARDDFDRLPLRDEEARAEAGDALFEGDE